MKRKLLSVLLATVLLLTCIPLGAVSAEEYEGDYEYTVSDGKATITGYAGSGGAITIPATLGGYPVTTIGRSAFRSCDSLTSVTIPDSITTIGYQAFYDCDSLTSVTIGDSVTTIGSSAFYGTGYYNNSNNWENGVLYIGKHLIEAEETLSGSYSIKDGTLTIASSAFCSCTSLTSVTIPDSVTTIGSTTFEDCTSLTSVTIGNGVTAIGEEAFYNCTSLTSVTIPDSVTTIGMFAFWYCTSLTSVTIGNGVTTIGSYAFENCTSLTSVTIPDSVTAIGGSAFYKCTSLTSVTIPDSVTAIGDWAFEGCYSLTAIEVDENNTNYCSVDGVLFNKDKTTLIQYPGGKSGAYAIPNSVTTIGEYAFCNCTSLTSVTIPDSVITIGDGAFSGCTSLTTVTIPDSVTTIWDYAFYYCTSLTDVYYTGTKTQAQAIYIDDYNDCLLNATWHYASDPFSADVQHSVMDTENGNGLAFRFQLEAEGVTTAKGNVADLTNATVNYLGQTCKLVGMGAVVTNNAAVGTTDFTQDAVNGVTVMDVPVVYLCDYDTDYTAFSIRIINIPDSALERTIYARPYYIVEVEGEQITVYGDVDSASCAEYM